MLTLRKQSRTLQLRVRQSGVVLMITLIVLVAMTLAAIALVRSVDTTNVIAGNLAFKEASINAADRGAQAAVVWLESASTLVYNDNPTNGYTASQQQPAAGVSWDSYWNNTIVPNNLAVCAPTNCAPDAAGNVVSYTINRLCNSVGAPSQIGVVCSYSPSSYVLNSSQGGGTVVLTSVNQEYYRITIRVDGPRNTVSYTQVVVAL
jgi:type IV pilus assembly protein PilX